MDNYQPPILTVEKADGCYIVDSDGKSYLDMTSGIGVNCLGHCHQRVIQAVAKQMVQFAHVSNLFAQPPQRKLAEKLCLFSDMEKILFVNSGAEATEAAIKLARKWGNESGKTELVGFSSGFHGRTTGALAVTGNQNYAQPFRPLLPATRILPYNDCAALDTLHKETAAVILEYVQGEGGLQSATSAFSRRLEEKRAECGFLIIADEIQSGMGRTGTFFAHQHVNAHPDVVLMAKAIGGGLPLGAVLAKGVAAHTFAPGDHGTTFGGNPVSCAAGYATLCELEEKNLIERAATMGTYLKSKLEALKIRHSNMVLEVRGMGLMCGIALSKPAKSVSDRMLESGVIVNVTAGNVIRLLPPLIITQEEIDVCITALDSALSASDL